MCSIDDVCVRGETNNNRYNSEIIRHVEVAKKILHLLSIFL